jgi:lipid-A-disaccharide synthase
MLVKIKHIGLVNILAGREVVRELIQGAADPATVAGELRTFLESAEKREALRADLAETTSMLGGPGAHERAAAAVAAWL